MHVKLNYSFVGVVIIFKFEFSNFEFLEWKWSKFLRNIWSTNNIQILSKISITIPSLIQICIFMARMVALQLAVVRLSKATNSVIILPNSVPVYQFKLSAIWTAICILITVRPNPTHRHTNTPTPTHPGKYIWATSRLRRKLKFGMESLLNQLAI